MSVSMSALVLWLASTPATARTGDCPHSAGRLPTLLVEGEIGPVEGSACLARALKAPGRGAEKAAEAVAKSFPKALQGQDPDVITVLVSSLLPWLQRHSLEPKRSARARAALQPLAEEGLLMGELAELHRILQLDAGRWDGAPLTARRLQALHDQEVLEVAVERLADPGLRETAARRLVDLRLAASVHPELRGALAEEARLTTLTTGRFALPRDRYPVVGVVAWKDVLVLQQGAERDVPGIGTLSHDGALPGVHLPLVVGVGVDGLKTPVARCDPALVLDPTPCLDADRLAFAGEQPRFVAIDDVPQVLRDGAMLHVTIDGEPESLLADVAPGIVPVQAWTGSQGSAGPDLDVVLATTDSSVIAVTVTSGEDTWRGWVDPNQQEPFGIESRGGRGVPGAPGEAGAPGHDGLPGLMGQCPNRRGGPGQPGADGFAGEPGGPGGDGGAGGIVRVRLDCATHGACDVLQRAAVRWIRSEGGDPGPGGPGGVGGRGGRGGDGGLGNYCRDGGSDSQWTVSAGSPGPAGRRGPDGPAGAPGGRGARGVVTLEVPDL